MDNGVTYPDEGLDAFAAPTDGHHLARNRRAAHSSAHMTTHLRYVYVNIVCTLCVPLALARVSIFFLCSLSPFETVVDWRWAEHALGVAVVVRVVCALGVVVDPVGRSKLSVEWVTAMLTTLGVGAWRVRMGASPDGGIWEVCRVHPHPPPALNAGSLTPPIAGG